MTALIPLILFCIALYLLAGATAAEALLQLNELADATNELVPPAQRGEVTSTSRSAWWATVLMWPALLPAWLFARRRGAKGRAA